jgi:hypothetical protein
MLSLCALGWNFPSFLFYQGTVSGKNLAEGYFNEFILLSSDLAPPNWVIVGG